MTEKTFSCRNCGAPLSNYAQAEVVRCKYCGTAFGDEVEVEPLKQETPDHTFKPPEPVQISEFERRTMKWALDAVTGQLISRVMGACMPYIVLVVVVVAVVIALIIWGLVVLLG